MGSEPTESWDAIVVGSGPGGLTTAACLASAGKRVLVVERHNRAGGNMQIFRRQHEGDGYEFDVGVHYLGEGGPGGLFTNVFAALGLAGRMNFLPMDTDCFDTLHFPDFTFRVPASWDKYQERLVDQFPREKAGVEKCLRILRTVSEEARKMFGEERPTFDLWATRPLNELFDECEMSTKLCAVLDHWSGLYAGGPSQTAVAMHAGIIGHYMNGAYYPQGGGQMMAARLVQAIEACGGEVRCIEPVERIAVENGNTTGVVLEDGRFLAAPLVISNADYRRTVEHLVGAQHLASPTVRWAQEATMTLGLVCTYVVVNKELTGPNTNYFVFSGYETDEYYSELDQGQLPSGQVPFAYIALASRKDPGNAALCPPGHTNFQIMSLAPRGNDYWGVETGPADGGKYRRNDTYRTKKDVFTERLLDAAETAFGPLRENIVHLETATTLSHERYISSSGGTSYGYQHSPEQTGKRRPAYRTEVEGLWVVGANTVSGHGIAGAMSGGVFCAGEILDRPLIAEIYMGEQLIDPALIPPDPADFDPLMVSRGDRLRKLRAKEAS